MKEPTWPYIVEIVLLVVVFGVIPYRLRSLQKGSTISFFYVLIMAGLIPFLVIPFTDLSLSQGLRLCPTYCPHLYLLHFLNRTKPSSAVTVALYHACYVAAGILGIVVTQLKCRNRDKARGRDN